MKHILPFVSTIDDNRFPVCVFTDEHKYKCECEDATCSQGVFMGDEDPHSPMFCEKHYCGLHTNGSYSLQPMNEEELKMFFASAA